MHFSLGDLVTENKGRRVNNSFSIFVQSLMFFMDCSDKREKLGVIRLLLCNINCRHPSPDNNKQIENLIDAINKLIEDTPKEDTF